MKKIILLILFTLTLTTVFSQVGNDFLFLQDNIKLNPTNIYSNSNFLRHLDILNHQNQIDERGSLAVRLDSTIAVSVNGNKSKETYYYNEHGKIASYYIEFWQNNRWELSWRIVYTYDFNGRVSKIIDATYFKGKWTNFSRETYFYNSIGKIDYFLSELWQYQSDGWGKAFKETYFYDDAGNNITIVERIFNGHDFINKQKISYSYKLNGLTNSMLFQDWSDENWQNNILVKYEYDNVGNRILAINQKWNNDKWENNFKGGLEYDTNDNMIFIQIDIWSGSKWNNLDRLSMNYNSGNNFISGYSEHFINNEWVLRDGTISFYAPGGFVVGTITTKLYAYYSTITDVKGNEENLIKSFNLIQNYPNPFNPTTNISFEIPKSEIVTLKVFNTLGKKVKTLINNEQKAAGKYTVQFNGDNLASGIYIYKIQFGNFTMSKKMILLR